MRRFLKTVIAAAFSGAVAAMGSPASAQGFSFGFGSGGVTFSYSSGGFCDSWGCPSRYWDMPVYYGPIFYRGDWYQGPVYYRIRFGVREYWVRGAWHRDEWRGPRPVWARNFRVGPALGFEYYDRNGFGVRDEWRRQYYGPNWNRPFNQPGFSNRPGFNGPNFNGQNYNNNRLGAGIPGGYQDNNGDFRDDRSGRPLEDVLNLGNPGRGFNAPPNQGAFPGARGNFQPQGPVNNPPQNQNGPGRFQGNNGGNFQPGNNTPNQGGGFQGRGNFQQQSQQPVNTPPPIMPTTNAEPPGNQLPPDQGGRGNRGARGSFNPAGQQGQVTQPPAAASPADTPPPSGRAAAGQRDPRADDMEQMRSRFRNNNNN